MQITNVIIGCAVVGLAILVAISFAIEESQRDEVLRYEIQEELRQEVLPEEIVEEKQDGTIVFKDEGGRLYSI